MFEGHAQDAWVSGCDQSRPVPGSEVRLPVLIVVHGVMSSPGHVGRWFTENGHRLDIRRPFAGEPLPATLTGHSGAVIFGGPQSANDNLDYIRREIDWIGVPLKERKPLLGICLGAQMLARHLGARVDHCPAATVEIGYHEIRPTVAGERLALPRRVYHWHREGFELPRGAKLLATSEGCYPHQAMEVDTAVGLQFHPEITLAQVNRWSGGNTVRLLMRGARPREAQLSDHLIEAPIVSRWLDGFLRSWISGRIASRVVSA